MGGKTSTTTQQVQIPKEVMDRYNSVNKRAEGLADTPFKQYSSNPADFVAQLNDQQKTGFNTVNNAANSYQGYMGQAADAVGAGMGSPRSLHRNRRWVGDSRWATSQSRPISRTEKTCSG